MKIKLLFWCWLVPLAGFADEWPELQRKRYYSSNRIYFADVIPANRATACYVKVYEKRAKGITLKWQQSLANKEAPANVVVSPDGKSIVTLDNWYSIGRGANVFVIYDAKGQIGKSYQLKDFSPFPINSFPRSASSINWSCGVQYTDNTRVQLCFKNQSNETKHAFYNILSSQFE